jgi:hypothetical protein
MGSKTPSRSRRKPTDFGLPPADVAPRAERLSRPAVCMKNQLYRTNMPTFRMNQTVAVPNRQLSVFSRRASDFRQRRFGLSRRRFGLRRRLIVLRQNRFVLRQFDFVLRQFGFVLRQKYSVSTPGAFVLHALPSVSGYSGSVLKCRGLLLSRQRLSNFISLLNSKL